MNKRILPILILCFFSLLIVRAQELPVGFAPGEDQNIAAYLRNLETLAIPNPPAYSGIRNPAEWEELQALVITWRSYPDILSQIVDAAQQECQVIINCTNPAQVQSTLQSNGVVPNANVIYNQVSTNSVWVRDYGPNAMYSDDVDSLFIVDWVYNRPSRPQDDAVPHSIASLLGVNIYETSSSPYTLVHTGGNYMSDGFGTAFSSNLIMDENPSLSTTQVDNIMLQFMGIQRYIKMPTLPYDGIHHIDMHMKLLDEQTLLFGEFPQGVSDGPQIEANILYVVNNFNSVFGTPYKIVRIPMPASPGGNYPGPGNAYYRTYANGVFVNKSFIYPSYHSGAPNTQAYQILQENLPGYTLVPINCEGMISASGAIHCITHEVASENPLLISHQPIEDVFGVNPPYYTVNARIQHRSGIDTARIYYRIGSSGAFTAISMSLNNITNHSWSANIPQANPGDTIHYYIWASDSANTKYQQRPITAPQGYWKFVISPFVGFENIKVSVEMENVFPNPASAITCIPVHSDMPGEIKISMFDIHGRMIQTIHEGFVPQGESFYFFDASEFVAGTYIIRLQSGVRISQQKVILH